MSGGGIVGKGDSTGLNIVKIMEKVLVVGFDLLDSACADSTGHVGPALGCVLVENRQRPLEVFVFLGTPTSAASSVHRHSSYL